MQRPIIATQTLDTINSHLQKDQGASFRRHLRHLMPLAEDAYNDKEESFRTHLGASLIGRKCPRELWYSFRWAIKPNFEGRILRLFNRGHLEEPRMVALLLMIGCKVWQFDEEGKQFRISSHYGHAGGSLDGVVLGIPEIPKEPLLAEFKTHADKSFLKVKKEGVRLAKFEHFVQMQMYMGKHNLNWALYMAVNKNNDDLYPELVQFEPRVFEVYENRFSEIIDAKEAPKRISDSPGWFECRLCDYRGICHGAGTPEKNCRTCCSSIPNNEGCWECQNDQIRVDAEVQGWEEPILLSKKDQLNGCDFHEYHQDLR